MTPDPALNDTAASKLVLMHGAARFSATVVPMIRGSVGFAIVSVAAFSVWAFGGMWLQNHWGEIGLYACCAIVFVGLSGVLLYPLLRGPGSLLKFYSTFIPAFIGYAVSWCVAWFLLGFGPGEWLGSLAGSAVFVAVVSWRLGNRRSFLLTTVVVFALHSAGYFLGGKAMQWLMGTSGSTMFSGTTKTGLPVIAKLAWGLLYGLGFGAGIGYAFSTMRKGKNAPTDRAV